MENKQETVNKWFTSHCYLNGLAAYPHDSVNRRPSTTLPESTPERWNATFKFLRETNLDSLPVGKYKLLEDDVVVSVTEGITRPMGNTPGSFTKGSLPLQYIYKGREMMGAAPIGSLTPTTTPYDDTKDVGFGDV
jgi:beta-galactosidase beta subunit